MLELRNIHVVFGDRVVLESVTLRLERGQKVALTGPSGSGKSTLLKVALLFQRPECGEVFWNGQPVTTSDLGGYRSRLLYIGQKPLPFDGTVAQYLHLPFTFAANRHTKADPVRHRALLRAMNLSPELGNALYASLSGGEQQRVTIIQGLQLDRPCCLLDEVTSSLDEEAVHSVVALLAGDPERTVLAVTHNHRVWLEHGFTVVRLENGRLEAWS